MFTKNFMTSTDRSSQINQEDDNGTLQRLWIVLEPFHLPVGGWSKQWITQDTVCTRIHKVPRRITLSRGGLRQLNCLTTILQTFKQGTEGQGLSIAAATTSAVPGYFLRGAVRKFTYRTTFKLCKII
jgi:hypothetical protein